MAKEMVKKAMKNTTSGLIKGVFKIPFLIDIAYLREAKTEQIYSTSIINEYERILDKTINSQK